MNATEDRNIAEDFHFMVGKSAVTVGRFTYGYENKAIKQWREGASLKIGSFCSISRGGSIYLGGNHRSDRISTFPFGHIFNEELQFDRIDGHPSTKGDVVIGNDVWLGQHVSIMSGVTIGDGAIVGAHSLVTKDVAPYAIVGGNPAKLIRSRFSQPIIELLLKLRWWDLPVDEIRQIVGSLSDQPTEENLLQLLVRYRS